MAYTKDEWITIRRFLEEQAVDASAAEMEFTYLNDQKPDGMLRLWRTRARWAHDYLQWLADQVGLTIDTM